MPNGKAFGHRSRSSRPEMRKGISGMLRIRVLASAWLTVALVYAPAMHAHEIGTSRVAVRFQDGQSYQVEIVTDATALAEKLEASVGASLPANTSAPTLQSLIANFDERFRQRVKLSFDGLEVRPAITYSVEPPIDAASAAAATIRLTGEIPRD